MIDYPFEDVWDSLDKGEPLQFNPFDELMELMYNHAMIESGRKVVDRFPYLVKGEKWWVASTEGNTIILQWGNKQGQRGVKYIEFDSEGELIDDFNSRIAQKIKEGYKINSRCRLKWSDRVSA